MRALSGYVSVRQGSSGLLQQSSSVNLPLAKANHVYRDQHPSGDHPEPPKVPEHQLPESIHWEAVNDQCRLRSISENSNHPEESTTFMRGQAPASPLCQSL